MIETIVLEQKWLPKDVGSLFCDDIDYMGIGWVYDAILRKFKAMQPKK